MMDDVEHRLCRALEEALGYYELVKIARSCGCDEGPMRRRIAEVGREFDDGRTIGEIIEQSRKGNEDVQRSTEAGDCRGRAGDTASNESSRVAHGQDCVHIECGWSGADVMGCDSEQYDGDESGYRPARRTTRPEIEEKSDV